MIMYYEYMFVNYFALFHVDIILAQVQNNIYAQLNLTILITKQYFLDQNAQIAAIRNRLSNRRTLCVNRQSFAEIYGNVPRDAFLALYDFITQKVWELLMTHWFLIHWQFMIRVFFLMYSHYWRIAVTFFFIKSQCEQFTVARQS